MIQTWRMMQLMFALILCFGLAGCGKGKSNPKSTSVFDSAPPEIKDVWLKAVAADNANDYVTAVTAYRQVLARQSDISNDQYLTAQQAFGLLNQRLVNNSLKGDPDAKQALDTLKKTDLRR